MTSMMNNPAQEAIRAKCFHPTGTFVEFTEEEVGQSIPDRFEKIVRQFPDRVAIKTQNSTWNYDQLNEASNRIARAILAQCGEKTEPVALALENGADAIAGFLGILKAGKICVPLDPLQPAARVASILEDSAPSAIVTRNRSVTAAALISQDARHLILLDEMDAHLFAGSLELHISPDAFAFILYTSGSTGQPKGVIQSHRNILQWTSRTTNRFHICAEDRIALLASLGGGQAKATAFNALLNGATLYEFNIKQEGVTRLADWLISEEITVYTSAATVFRDFGRTLVGAERFPKLRLVRLGAEQIRKSDVEFYKKHFSPECFFGTPLSSTEAGSGVCHYLLNKQAEVAGEIVPVGYPAEDVEIILINDAGEKVGFNETGEITIRSRYLSPGYWRRPDLTEAKFKPDPDGGDRRLYFTGDLGLMLPDGCLIHKGRKDFRVKIRGYSVETAEVETALRAHAAINEAVVVAHGNKSGELRLVAYFTSRSQRGPTVSELRGFLKKKLPDYMVPSAFVFLDALPLAPNGKVERQALPAPPSTRPELDTPFVAPRTPVEEALARIWAELLGLDQVGIHDNFLELGGHSLLATQIISRVIDKFRVELSVRSLLEAPTVAEMAVVVAQNQAKKASEEDLNRMLAELEALSDEEAERLLSDKST